MPRFVKYLHYIRFTWLRKVEKVILQTIKDATDRLSTEPKAALAALTGSWIGGIAVCYQKLRELSRAVWFLSDHDVQVRIVVLII